MALAFQGIPSLRCQTTTQGGLAHRYDESDVRRIRAYDLDFLLRCGFGALDGEILRGARYGVRGFRHGGEPLYGEIKARLWPIFDGDAGNAMDVWLSPLASYNAIALPD